MDSVRANPTVAESIREATADAMREDDSVILFGLGVNDPGRVFGTTSGLVEEFGTERVFETPTAENGVLGVAVGAALGGLRPIVTHQRADFFLLAMDQLINSAAKWRFMFGGQFRVPLVVRVVVGRGWGQGPTHSQNFSGWLAQVPGLRVFYPSSPQTAYSLTREAIEEDNPVLMFEDRWLHDTRENVSDHVFTDSFMGSDSSAKEVTLVSFGYGSLLCRRAIIEAHSAVRIDFVDLFKFDQPGIDVIRRSVDQTQKLVVVDQGNIGSDFARSIVSRVLEGFDHMTHRAVKLVTLPDGVPQPTSYGAMAEYHPGVGEILEAVFSLVGRVGDFRIDRDLSFKHDVPGFGPIGPF